MSANSNGWWTFHGDPARTGYVAGSGITSATVSKLKTLATLQLGGPVLSVPAIADGYVFVGTANGMTNGGQSVPNGGSLHKINLASGTIEKTFNWATESFEGDTHGFTGMGCTPAIVDGKLYFSAFNGKVYCLTCDSLELVWSTDLRNADPNQNQPVTNIAGVKEGNPQAEGWCSPLVVNDRVYVGIGEGENPDLYAFVFCLDAQTGRVLWIFCTNQFEEGQDNPPNVLPADVVTGDLPPGFSLHTGEVSPKGCAVWSAIAYDAGLNRLYCATGNPQPDSTLPSKGYSYGVLSLDAETGKLKAFFRAIPQSSYRASDLDVDFGASPTVFTRAGKQAVCVGCKNGGFFVLDADTLELITWRQLLPYYNDGTQIETVDPHGPDTSTNPNPRVSNEESNNTLAENFHGTYSTTAIDPVTQRLFIGTGGNNYHFIAAGIDSETTPFLRAMDWNTLDDAWEMDDSNPKKYVKPTPPMYTTPGEAGLSSPAVVNDVVFCSTSKISLYAFNVHDGTLLWSDDLGMQTGGFQGGYGYCLGPAVCGNYVVAGGLIYGRDGGILRIYTLGQ